MSVDVSDCEEMISYEVMYNVGSFGGGAMSYLQRYVFAVLECSACLEREGAVCARD